MKQWKYIVYVFIVLVCPMQAFAQTELISCDKEVESKTTDYDCQVAGGVHHAIEGVICTFKLSLAPGYGLAKCISKIVKDGEEYWSKEQSATEFSYEVTESGRYQLILEDVKLDSIGEGGKDTTICKKIPFEPFEVKLYNAPIQVRDEEPIEIKLKGDSWDSSWADGSEINMEKDGVGDGFFSYILSEYEIKWEKDSTEKEVCERELIFTNKNNGVTEEFKVIIYKKPLRPDSLKCKGNGKSWIYIASSPFKDGYIFGDGDNSEDCDTICEDATGTRKNYYHAFYRYENKPKDAWVSTYWVYNGKFDYEYDYGKWEISEEIDGSKVYCESERLKFNSAKSAPSRALRVEKGYFSVNLEEEASAVVALYRLDGKIVKEQHYAPQIDFDEKLDFDGVASGMYIIKCTVGEQQVVRKIMVR